MFKVDLTDDRAQSKVSRRAFLASAAAIGAGLYFWSRSKTQPAEAHMPNQKPPEDVTIVEFADSGERKGVVHEPKIVKSDSEWKQQLTPNAFDIARHEDTEMAFSGEYWNTHDKGLYRCVFWGNALFSSDTKFESGTGCPSFWQPIAEENIADIEAPPSPIPPSAAPPRPHAPHLCHS